MTNRTMRAALLILLVWSPAAHAQPTFQPPTATEVFNLRSRCAALGRKFLDELSVGSVISKELTSHYDPRSNRCYGDVRTRNISGLSYYLRSLYDLQTGEMLAFARIENGERIGKVFVGPPRPSDLGFANANEFIDQMMKEER